MHAGRLLGWLACALVAACDVSSLTDFELVECDPAHDNDKCEPLNMREGIGMDVCVRYQCAKDGMGGCTLSPKDTDGDGALDPVCADEVDHEEADFDCDDASAARTPGQPEDCDGVDNDCDLAIDEGAIDVVDVAEQEPHMRAAQAIDYAWSDALVATVADDDTTCGMREDGSLGGACDATLVELEGAGATNPLLAPQCPLATSEQGRFLCNLAAVALGETRDGYLAAAVNVQGNPLGQLRLGVVDLQRTTFQAGESNTSLGVDVTEMAPRSTGASRLDGRLGVAGLRLATQHPDGRHGQGVVAWLGDGIDRPACGGDEVVVEALGVWLDDTTQPKSVQGTNRGLQQKLGTTRGGGAPAIEVWEGTSASRGYFVGYGDAESEALALRFVPRLPRLERDGAGPALDTPPLEPGEAFVLSAGEGTPDHVAMARSGVRDVCDAGSGVELGVAWLDGCGSADAGLWFAVVGYAPESDTFCVRGEPLQLAAGDASGAQLRPSVSYLDRGFFEPGYVRDGASVDGTNDGGWLVVWGGEHDGESALVGARVAELDGRPVDPAERLVLSAGGQSVEAVFTAARETGAAVVYHAGDAGRFVVGQALACAPR